jgi:GT2 family glycosyltransferase/ADP-heptose:LPS heptosyltransferase
LDDTDYEIIVCEDGGPKKEEVKQECERRGIRAIISSYNGGFAKNVNQGIRESSGEIVVLVNNDVQFTKPVTRKIRDSFEVNGRIGIVGSLLFYPHGTIQHGGIYILNNTFSHRGWHKTYVQAPEVHQPGYLMGCTGALLALRKEMIEEIGLLNEKYFLSCEDTEYCLRAWSRDWRVYYNPEVTAIHAEGHTRGKTHDEKIKYHREWWIKELDTWGKFQEDLSRYDLNRIQEKVTHANAEAMGVPIERQMGADRMVFQGTGVIGVTDKKASKTILVRRTGALGDALLASGVIKKLKKDNPEAEIVVSSICGDVFRGNPNVSKVVRSLEGVQADKFYDLDLSYEMNPKVPVWEAYSRTVFGEAVLDASAIEMYSTELDWQTTKAKLGSINPDKDNVAVLHMGVGWPSRTWAKHSWQNVVSRLAQKFKVIVIGRGGDFRADHMANVLNLVDHLSIFEVRELCARASVFVGMDSGMLHVAQTTDVPIVGLFTVANPTFRVVPRPTKTVALIPKSSCRFCLHEQNPPVTYVECKYKTNHCLIEITPDDVVSETEAIARMK